MLLPILIFIPFFGGFLCIFFNKRHIQFSHYIALISMGLVFILSFILLFQNVNLTTTGCTQNICYWSSEYFIPWISKFGISFHLAVDRLSILMLNLTGILGLISIIFSLGKIKKNIGLFYLSLLWTLGSAIGIFISIDLFLFFCFWEFSIFPIYFLVVMWGHKENNRLDCFQRIFSANKFFVYSQISGLILLFSILVLVYTHYMYNHNLTFDYISLCNTKMSILLESFIMFGFFLAFAIKVPLVPFHGWLPDFHTYSPITGSVDLSGILLKTSLYALMRFNFPLFPHATKIFSPIIMWLGVITIFYGAIVSFLQNNIRRFIAYTSISHMGFSIIAIYSINQLAYQGAIVQIISYSLSTSALFLLSGKLFSSTATFNMNEMGGLWSNLKWISGFFLFFSVANLGIPGTGNFVGEFMILMGCFSSQSVIASFSAFSLVISALCSLMIVQRVYFGPMNKRFFVPILKEISISDFWVFIFLWILLLLIGFYPKIILDISRSSLCNIHKIFSNFI